VKGYEGSHRQNYFGMDGWRSQQIFFYLPFISLSCYLCFIPDSSSAKMHVEGENKTQV
jgi:hypothetical protein